MFIRINMTTLLLLFLFLLYYLTKHLPEEEAKKWFILCTSFVLFLISGLRHEAVGNDTFAYMLHFERTLDTSWSEIFRNFLENYLNPVSTEGKDPAYSVFVKLVGTILPNSRLYLFVIAAIFLTSIGYFIHTFSVDLRSTLFCYVFYISMFYGYLPNSAIRQSLALSIVLFAYCLAFKRNLIWSVLLVLLASTFHKSALLALLFFMFIKIKNVKIVYAGSFLLFLVMLVFSNEISLFFADSANDIYSGYLSGSYYGETSKPIMVVILFFSLFVLSLYGLRLDDDYVYHRPFYYGTALTLVFVPLVWVNPNLLRVLSYFVLWMGIMVQLLLRKAYYGKVILFGIILVFLMYSLKSINSYRFMWQHMELHERYSSVIHPKTCIDDKTRTIFAS